MSNNKYKILLVEDDRNIASFVQTMLDANGYQVLLAECCRQGILMQKSHVPDLVILDLGLPDVDGMEFIRTVRKDSRVPIVVLSARTEETDKVDALDLGANDYITKPFGSAELLARVRTALRTVRHNMQTAAPSSVYVLDDMEVDYDRRQVRVGNTEIHMTQTEFNILSYLSQHEGKVMTYASIIRAIWGGMDDGSIKKLQVNMANIRKKLGDKPGEQNYIANELGVGYRLNA